LAKILKLVEKVIEVNENTKHDVFFEIVPRVKCCEIRIYEGGCKEKTRNRAEYIRFYYDEYYKKEDYDKMINRLEELLND